MGDFWKKRFAVLLTLGMVAVMAGIPVFAGGIPETGDGASRFLPIMGGLLVLSVVLLVIYMVLQKKKK